MAYLDPKNVLSFTENKRCLGDLPIVSALTTILQSCNAERNNKRRQGQQKSEEQGTPVLLCLLMYRFDTALPFSPKWRHLDNFRNAALVALDLRSVGVPGLRAVLPF